MFVLSRTWNETFVLTYPLIISKVISWTWCYHVFKIFIMLILTWTNNFRFLHIIPRGFRHWPFRICLFYFTIWKLIIWSWTWCFWHYHWTMHVSCHYSTYFWIYLFFRLILTWTRNKTHIIFNLNSGSKSIFRLIFTTIFKNSILIIIRARTWHFTILISNFGIMTKFISAFFMELWYRLILTWTRFIL